MPIARAIREILRVPTCVPTWVKTVLSEMSVAAASEIDPE
jgi:hypothetical protein